MLLLKHRAQNESNIVVSYINKPVVFRHGVYGVTAKNNVEELKFIYGLLISDLFTYYQFLTSSSWGVATRPEIKLEEYLSFPLPDVNHLFKETILGAVEEILSTYENWYEHFRLGLPYINPITFQILNDAIEKVWGISCYKRDLIDYVLNISRYQFQENKQYLSTRKLGHQEDTLEKYIDVFVTEFENLYKDEYIKVYVYTLEYFIAINFVFQYEKPQSVINFVTTVTEERAVFEILSNNTSIYRKTQNLYIQKDIKGFEENSFYIIKPNEYKCWHRAMAWYDVAEIKQQLRRPKLITYQKYGMPLNAEKFILNRGKDIVSITSDRIHHIMSYALECYQLLLAEGPTYSKAHVAAKTAFHFEDYLKMEFVDGYLIKNKHLLAAKLSTLEEVSFTYETVKPFTDVTDGKSKSDKIDVYVNRLGLKDKWEVEEEHLYLAIECKRITKLSDCQNYIDDIQKFCDREYKELRIPFEGQIAFIENPKLNHVSVSDEINRRLKSVSTITTKQYLKLFLLQSSFQGSYSTIHKKNFKNKNSFTIFHLLFDYSGLVSPDILYLEKAKLLLL